MIRTQSIPCHLPKIQADTLNQESGRIYTETLVWHYRIYRHTGHWLSCFAAKRMGDYFSNTILTAHSRDAAQEGFYKACKTAKTNRRILQGSRYPHKRKLYRTTIWKNTGIRQREGYLLLSLARGSDPIRVDYATSGKILEARLVYNLKHSSYDWHFVVEDGQAPSSAPGTGSAAIDLGEIHPVAITDGTEVLIVSCRALRSAAQHSDKVLAEIAKKRSRCVKDSRRMKRLNRAKSRFLAKQKRRRRDMEHKVSRVTIDWCREKEVGTLYIGDVRDVADKTKIEKRLSRGSRQKVSHWPHGTIRRYLGYKAEAAGISLHDRVPEHHTSQTCPSCGARHKPKGRVYSCACGFVFPRDGVGCANILSRALYGVLGKVRPSLVKYRRPFQKHRKDLRSPVRHPANCS